MGINTNLLIREIVCLPIRNCCVSDQEELLATIKAKVIFLLIQYDFRETKVTKSLTIDSPYM